MKVYHAAYTIFLYCLTDSCNIFFCCCQRFFDQNIFLCICHSAGNISMCKIRCYDCNCINLLISCHIMIICIYFTDSKFICNLSRSRFIHITDCFPTHILVIFCFVNFHRFYLPIYIFNIIK